MATIAEIARQRRADFRELLKASRALDAAQEKLEREIKRLTTRKDKVPEVDDAERIANLMSGTQNELNNMATLMKTIAQHWAGL